MIVRLNLSSADGSEFPLGYMEMQFKLLNMFLDNIGFLLLCNNFVSSIIQGNDLFRTKTTQYEEREFPLYSIWNPLLRIYMVSSEGSLYLIFSKQLLSSAFS